MDNNKTLVIMDYSTGVVHIYPATGYITDDSIEELGYDLDEVSWMVTKEDDCIKYHKNIVK